MELGNPRDIAALRSLIELLRESGVTSYRDGALELTLGAAPAKGEETSTTQADPDDDGLDKDGLSSIPEPYRRAFGVNRG